MRDSAEASVHMFEGKFLLEVKLTTCLPLYNFGPISWVKLLVLSWQFWQSWSYSIVKNDCLALNTWILTYHFKPLLKADTVYVQVISPQVFILLFVLCTAIFSVYNSLVQFEFMLSHSVVFLLQNPCSTIYIQLPSCPNLRSVKLLFRTDTLVQSKSWSVSVVVFALFCCCQVAMKTLS